MSRSTLYAAGPDGDMHPVEEYSNSWWSAMCVWTFMADRYLFREQPESGHWLGNKPFMKKLWQLADEPRAPWIERVALASTFDRALVRGSERAAIVNAFRAFMTLVSSECHLGAMADDIEALPQETRAVGWQQTSVAESLWWVYDEDRVYNIDRDEGHVWLFDELP